MSERICIEMPDGDYTHRFYQIVDGCLVVHQGWVRDGAEVIDPHTRIVYDVPGEWAVILSPDDMDDEAGVA